MYLKFLNSLEKQRRFYGARIVEIKVDKLRYADLMCFTKKKNVLNQNFGSFQKPILNVSLTHDDTRNSEL